MFFSFSYCKEKEQYYVDIVLYRGVAWFLRVGTHGKHKEKERRRREALGVLPQKIFTFRVSEMRFPMFFRGNFHKSKHEKTLTIPGLPLMRS